MKWIGLTGSIGAGKSTVANLIRLAGFPVIDADALAHEGLVPGTPTYQAIVAKFGESILGPGGEIRRRDLGQIIFSDRTLRSWLEKLLHPMVQQRVRELRSDYQQKGLHLAFYEVPLLFEKGLEGQFDQIVVVWTSDEVQRQRLKNRNQWSDQEIENRRQSQWPVAEKIRRADYAINNDGSLQELERKVQELIKALLE